LLIYYSGTVGGTVTNCTLHSGIYMLANGAVDFSSSTLHQNNTYPVTSYADHVGALTSGITFEGLDATSHLLVNSGNVTRDATWTAGIPICLSQNISVIGTDGPDNITTLTIDPGAQIRFKRYRSITVGATSGNPGALKAQGTAANPIVFTSNEASPAPGDWGYIRISNTADDTATILENLYIEYAGYGNYGALYVDNSAPAINAVTINNCSNFDMYYSGTVGGTVANSTFNSGIYMLANGTVDFSDNTMHYNNAYPVKTYADNVGTLTSGISFDNLDAASHLMVNSGNITRDATWTAGIPINLSQNMS
jgi:hypothetical protein